MLAGLLALSLLGATGSGPPVGPRSDSPFQQLPPLSVSPVEDEGERPAVRVGPVLLDEALEDAVRSGLPLRLRFRVELWKDRFIDALVEDREWIAVVAYDPLAQRFLVRAEGHDEGGVRSFSDYTQAAEAAQGLYRPAIVPKGDGRYYYRASLRVETLSLSDLEELENWLRGDLGAAVGGRESVPDALEEGMRRALIRLMGLPARIYEARSRLFRLR